MATIYHLNASARQSLRIARESKNFAAMSHRRRNPAKALAYAISAQEALKRGIKVARTSFMDGAA